MEKVVRCRKENKIIKHEVCVHVVRFVVIPKGEEKYAKVIESLLQYGTLMESPSSLQENTLVESMYTLGARELQVGIKCADHRPQETATT